MVGAQIARGPAAEARAAEARADASSRLALVESMLRSADPVECAQQSLEWLASVGFRWGICLTREVDSPRLVGVAGVGMPPEAARCFTVDPDTPDSEVIAVALRARGWSLIAARDARRLGLPRRPFAVTPLPLDATRPEERFGLLVLSPPPPPHLQEPVDWVTGVLGQRLSHLLAYRSLLEAEKRFARERTYLTGIANAVTDPILLTDTDGRMIVANTRAELLFASTEAGSEGRRRAVALNNMLFSAALSRSALSDAGTTQAELALVDPTEGSDLLFELLTTTLGDSREGTRLVSVLRNVTDLRRATQEIEENYRRLRSAEANVRAERDRLNLIIDSVADPIVVTDPSGNIALMNTPAERLFTTAGERDLQSAQRAVRANDARFSSFVSNVLAGAGMRRRGELSLVDPTNGAAIPFEGLTGKVLSEHGEVTAVVTILHDRTEALENARLYEQVKRSSAELEEKVRNATAELVRQNELLRRQHLALEQASALKSQFLANMSHEFRTPLNAIIGYTSMLLQGIGGKLTERQRRSLDRVESNAEHLLSIIQDLLDISRIEAGKMPLNLTEFEVSGLITEVMAEAEPLVARTRLEVIHQVPVNLPALRSDRHKVKQIVLNLLSNALKFTQDGHVRLVAGHEPTGARLWIAVEDSGIGIAEEDQVKVFEDFRQVDPTPARQYGGAGLGLSICRRLAEMLHGKLTLKSSVGTGSTFTLELPLRLRKT